MMLNLYHLHLIRTSYFTDPKNRVHGKQEDDSSPLPEDLGTCTVFNSYKTIDLITKYKNFTWECNQQACV